MATISIIVPVYNAEPYLKRCIDSILSQTFSDFEAILIDDGSPDGCPAICDEYAAMDDRIHAIHKENAGVSAARNDGVSAARGKYIAFADSDDLLEPTMLEVLVGLAERENADVVQCRHNRVEAVQNTAFDGDFRTIDGRTFCKELFTYQGGEYTNQVALWAKLFRRELFDGIVFPNGQTYEDERETYKICLKAEKIVQIRTELYHYVRRENSIITGVSAKSMLDKQDAYADRMHYLPKKLPELKKPCVQSFIGYTKKALCDLYRMEPEGVPFYKALKMYEMQRNICRQYLNRYDRIYFALLRLGIGERWICANDFTPMQNRIAKWKGYMSQKRDG